MDSVTRRIDETLARLRSGLDALSEADPNGRGQGLEAVTRLIDSSHDSLLGARREADRIGLAFRDVIVRGRQGLENDAGTADLDGAVGQLGADVQALDDRIRRVADQIDGPEEKETDSGRRVAGLEPRRPGS